MSSYTFSCYVKKNIPVLKRRSWWNLFGKDKIICKLQWERFVLNGLNEEQSQALQQANFLNDIWPSLFLMAINDKNISHVQLEEDSNAVEYIKTEGSIANDLKHETDFSSALWKKKNGLF